jgi:hypothetical protein
MNKPLSPYRKPTVSDNKEDFQLQSQSFADIYFNLDMYYEKTFRHANLDDPDVLADWEVVKTACGALHSLLKDPNMTGDVGLEVDDGIELTDSEVEEDVQEVKAHMSKDKTNYNGLWMWALLFGVIAALALWDFKIKIMVYGDGSDKEISNSDYQSVYYIKGKHATTDQTITDAMSDRKITRKEYEEITDQDEIITNELTRERIIDNIYKKRLDYDGHPFYMMDPERVKGLLGDFKEANDTIQDGTPPLPEAPETPPLPKTSKD